MRNSFLPRNHLWGHSLQLKIFVWTSTCWTFNYIRLLLVFLNKKKYKYDILSNFNLLDSTPIQSPLSTGLKRDNSISSPLSQLEVYKRLVSRLLNLSMTKVDVSYVVQHFSQYVFTLWLPYL